MARYLFLIPDEKRGPTGGIMNIVRHCALAGQLGAPALLTTDSGRDSHGRYWFKHGTACIQWSDRQPQDICVIPDIYTDRMAQVAGPCIAYLQSPAWIMKNFDHTRPDVQIWTDSPIMAGICSRMFPGKEPLIVPNIVDKERFPFVPQSQRRPGMMIVFPRKGADFIQAVFAEYRARGGRFWKPKYVDGIPFDKLTALFHQAQGFLASAEVEGCALPPQESMAAGVVVVGRDANGANFCMQHGKTAMVSTRPEDTAEHLRALEDPDLRNQLTVNAHKYIRRYFADAEPTRFWQTLLAGTSAHASSAGSN
jgi:hypothetical protein